MTLSFTWATNALYAAGPDLGSATKVDPASTANGFIKGVIAAPQHVNYLFDLVGDELAKAVDGLNGGTYGLASNLIFNGVGEVRFGGVARVISGGTFITEGSSIFNNTATFNLNAVFALAAHVQTGATFTVDSGGEILAESSGGIAIDDSGDGIWLTMTPQSIQPDTGGTDPSWLPGLSGVAFAGTVQGWAQADVNAAFSIAFPLNLPPGDDIVSLTANVDGSFAGVGHALSPVGSDMPTLALVRVDSTGTATVVARRRDQSANAAAYNSQHTISLLNGALDAGTLPHTILSTSRYYVVLHGATGANAEADKFGVNSISGTCLARKYRATTMVY